MYQDDDDDYIIICLVYYILLHIHGVMQESYQSKSVAMQELSSSHGVSKKEQGKKYMMMS